MAHCAHAPSCAWAASTEPKKRSHSIASRLGDAIRAMKPRARRTEEEPACAKLEDFKLMKQTFADDDVSTQSGGSRRSSTTSLQSFESVERQCSSAPLTEPVEEMVLPGTPEEISPTSSRSCTSPSSDLQALANVIADHAQSKFSGRVYQDVRNAFLAVDANGDGKLTPTEALAFCQHFDLSAAVTSRFFTLLDDSETGLADWSSFLARYAPVFTKKSDLRLNAGVGKKWPAIQ
jgi:hypothetical protein